MKKRLVLIFALLFLFQALPSPASAGENPIAPATGTEVIRPEKRKAALRVMTINIRHNKDFWEERFPLIADEIVRLRPDIIGLQEISIGIDQSKTLRKLINERSGGADGLKYGKYEHLKTGSYYLSGEGVGIYSLLPIEDKGFRDLENGRVVVYSRIRVNKDLAVDMYNTHLHNTNVEEVRLAQAEKITDFINEKSTGSIVFLTGDMNSHPDSVAIEEFIANGLEDTYPAAHPGEELFAGNTTPVLMSKSGVAQNFANRIDYVFVRRPENEGIKISIVDSEVCFKNFREDGLYPSDHLGVMTTFEIEY